MLILVACALDALAFDRLGPVSTRLMPVTA